MENTLLRYLFGKGMGLMKMRSATARLPESDLQVLSKRPREGISRSPRHRRTIHRWSKRRIRFN